MPALTASPPTKWPECTAIWTLCISSGARAGSPPPSPSPPWSSGRLPSPSLSTGCLQLVALYMTGERALACGWAGIFLRGVSYEWGKEREVRGTPVCNDKCAPLLRAASASLLRPHLLSRVPGALTQANIASHVPTPRPGAPPMFPYVPSGVIPGAVKRLTNVIMMTWQNWDGTCCLSRSAVLVGVRMDNPSKGLATCAVGSGRREVRRLPPGSSGGGWVTG